MSDRASRATSLGQGAGYPTTLHVVIGNPKRQTQRTIVIRFRSGVLGTGVDPARGSYPVGDGLTFADNHHLLLGTVTKGEGYQLTGVFIVPDTGGIARMVLGNGNGVHRHPPHRGSTQRSPAPHGDFRGSRRGPSSRAGRSNVCAHHHCRAA